MLKFIILISVTIVSSFCSTQAKASFELIRAIQDKRSFDAIQEIIARGADVDQKQVSSFGMHDPFESPLLGVALTSTPLSVALESEQLAVVKLLLKHGADPNQAIIYNNKHSLLEIAAHHDKYNKNMTFSKLLIEHGAYKGYENAILSAAQENNRKLLIGLIRLHKKLLEKNLISKGCLELIQRIGEALMKSSYGIQVYTQEVEEFKDYLVEECIA